MSSLISVVIPAFNHARFVGEAIQSVLDQSNVELEIIITDDGSSDGTPDVIRQFSDRRIELELFSENRGAAVALNSAIRRARGEFICMVSSDDYFLPGKLEKQIQFLEANPHVAALFGLPRLIDERGVPVADSDFGYPFRIPFDRSLCSREDWLRQFFFHGNCLCHPTAMVRRRVYDEVGYFDARLANLPDFDMWVRLCAKHDIHVLPDELTAMRVLDNNRNMSAPRRDTRLRTLIEYYEVLKKYLALPRDTIVRTFASDIAENGLNPDSSTRLLLAQLALLGQHPPHKLFALEMMFAETSTENANHAKLIELTGSIDVFGVDELQKIQSEVTRLSRALDHAQARASEFETALGAARAETNASQARASEFEMALGTAQAEVADLILRRDAAQARASELEMALETARTEVANLLLRLQAAQTEAARLDAALLAKAAEATTLGDAVQAAGRENARLSMALADEQAALSQSEKKRAEGEDNLARTRNALRAAQDLANDMTKSRTYLLLKHVKPVRLRIEQLATVISDALRG
jgi:glycosyltransferase involved in cell wall biosynthesis/predicted  nucleic acid-binding Zn-ribbon protein